MLKLSEASLDLALAAIGHHGYGDFFPEPPELEIARSHWDALRPHLADLDLDTYTGYDRVTTFAPKSRLNIRRVALLHPFDLLLYTALVLALRDDITAARLPTKENRVFSYRGEGAAPDILYTEKPSYTDFKERVGKQIASASEAFVGITDIGDFYPRIYQHKLVNALQAASGPSKQDHIRVLEKMLLRFSDGASYEIDFIRFTDDFVIFAATPQEAEYGLRILGETLFQNHGLTMQTAKTRVLPASEYFETHLTGTPEKEEARRKLLDIVGDYDEATAYEELTDDEKKEIDALNLSEMLKDALAEGKNVDYKEVSFILGRLSALQKPELIPIVLENLERLYPVAHSVASFFKEFSALDQQTREDVAKALLTPILDSNNVPPSEYYCIWILSLFHLHRD